MSKTYVSPSGELKDVTIIIAHTERNDANEPYAVTRVYRYDLEGPIDEFINALETECDMLICGGQMANE
jgi:hypothetical protein